MSNRQQTHSLERTSPKGGSFIGRCVLCGAIGLPSSAVFDACSNPQGLDSDTVVVNALIGDTSATHERGGDDFADVAGGE